MTTPIFLSVPETCRVVGVGRSTAFAMMRDGILQRRKIGRRTLITMESIERLAMSPAANSSTVVDACNHGRR